jgi:prevent-host-death family protein
MNSISVNQFRDNLKTYIEQTVSEHEPIKVTRHAGEGFIVMNADDWESQSHLYIICQAYGQSAFIRKIDSFINLMITVYIFSQ